MLPLNFNLEKWVNIFINTAPQVLLQLLCPWHISLHWSIAIIGGFLYLLFFFWLLSVLKIRKGALLIEHILIFITILAAIGELWLAKLMDEPLLVIRHRKELNSQINRFKKKCPLPKTTFYVVIEGKITKCFSLIQSGYNNCKSGFVKFPSTAYNFINQHMIEAIKKIILKIKDNSIKVLDYIRTKLGKF